MGVAVGDYDNDGRPDMYVSNFGVSRLYHNNGNGTFTDVAEKLKVARKGWSTGATLVTTTVMACSTSLFRVMPRLTLTT